MDFCVLIEIFVKNCYDVKKLFKNKKKRGFEMLSIIKSAALLGIDSYPVEVEVDLSNGLPAFDIVGLPDSAVKESRERVRTAIRNAGFSFPVKRITVNLAPADTKKEGAAFDLPIALGILSACNLFSAEKIEDALITGELSLDGSVRPVNGVLPMLYDALRRGISVSFVPFENAEEAALVEGMTVYPVHSVKEIVAHLSGGTQIAPYHKEGNAFSLTQTDTPDLDFSHVKGQENAKRAMEIAAAGGHNILGAMILFAPFQYRFADKVYNPASFVNS